VTLALLPFVFVGKFLNWCLVPLYSYVLSDASEYGIVTNLYAWTALVIIILTYGMETGFFRFVNNDIEDEKKTNRVYTTTLTSLAVTSIVFAILCVVFRCRIAGVMGYEAYPEFIAMLGVTVSMDAFGSIPFSYLRYKNRPLTFAALKLMMIFVNILCNLFFLVGCPMIMDWKPDLIDWFYNPSYGVGYIFVSNVISTTVVTVALLPFVFVGRWTFDWALLKRMLRYSMPLLLFGIAGIMNQTIDKIVFPVLYPDPQEGMQQLGIYGASFKVAMIMMMFTHAFRFAYEPFVFSKHGSRDSKESYADAMKYYIIAALLIFLGMVFYLDFLQYVLGPQYREGLRVIPIVLITYLVQGVVYNLSLWYKLIDKTIYGAWFSVIGFVITLMINVIFVPKYGYWASAVASLVSYIVMMLLSYFIGQRHYAIAYPLKSIGVYVVLTLALWIAGVVIEVPNFWFRMVYRTGLLVVFVVYVVKKDLPLSEIPLLKKCVKK
jgi:O-antigen/teichoic acid export membrane protein